MEKLELLKLKAFLEEHIPFADLKKVGFWLKGTRKTDYEKIAARICWYFGYESIYEYARHLPSEMTVVPEANIVVGKFEDKVTPDGYEPGGGFLITTVTSEFVCPICTCHQSIKDNNKMYYIHKCVGCKRPLTIIAGMDGSLKVFEKQQ